MRWVLGVVWVCHRGWGEPLSWVLESRADVDSPTDCSGLYSFGVV